MKSLVFATTAALLLGLTTCTIGASDSTVISAVLTQLANTAMADLQQQQAVALAATPPDNDGAACAGSALTVAAAMQKIAAVSAGKAVGAFTQAEIATLYQPGSAQFNWVVTTLETGCIAKVHDVNQAAQSQTSILALIPTILALAPAGA